MYQLRRLWSTVAQVDDEARVSRLLVELEASFVNEGVSHEQRIHAISSAPPPSINYLGPSLLYRVLSRKWKRKWKLDLVPTQLVRMGICLDKQGQQGIFHVLFLYLNSLKTDSFEDIGNHLFIRLLLENNVGLCFDLPNRKVPFHLLEYIIEHVGLQWIEFIVSHAPFLIDNSPEFSKDQPSHNIPHHDGKYKKMMAYLSAALDEEKGNWIYDGGELLAKWRHDLQPDDYVEAFVCSFFFFFF